MSRIVSFTIFPFMLEAGQKSNSALLIEVPDAELWSPEQPHLVHLVAQLIDAEGYSCRN